MKEELGFGEMKRCLQAVLGKPLIWPWLAQICKGARAPFATRWKSEPKNAKLRERRPRIKVILLQEAVSPEAQLGWEVWMRLPNAAVATGVLTALGPPSPPCPQVYGVTLGHWVLKRQENSMFGLYLACR